MHIYHKELDEISKEALSKRIEEFQKEFENVVAEDDSELTPIEKSFKYFPKKLEEAAKKKSDAVDDILINFQKQRADEFKKATGTTPEEIKQKKTKALAQDLVAKIQARGGTTDYLAGIAGEKKPVEAPKAPEAPKATPEKSVYQRQREIASALMKKRREQEAGSVKPSEPEVAPKREKTPFERQREISSQLMKKRREQETQATPEVKPAEPVSKSVEAPVSAPPKPTSKYDSFKDFLAKAKEKLGDVAWNVGQEAKIWKKSLGAAKDAWNAGDKEKPKFANPYSQKAGEAEKKK